jgi:hypothetical protein
VQKLFKGRIQTACGLILCLLVAGPVLAGQAGGVTITNRVPAVDEMTKGPAAPGSNRIVGLANALERADLEASIRSVYERFGEISRASSDEITFQISDITTYLPNQFDEILWLSLFDPPTGPTIETVPYELQGALPSMSVVNFRSAWQETDSTGWYAQDFLKEAGRLRVAGALDKLAAWDPARLDGIAAVSSFEVKVRFQERSRSYRAMILWKPLPSDSLLFTLVDHVVPGVELAYHEDRQVVRRAELESRLSAGQDQKALDGCYITSSDVYGPTLTTNTITLGHSTGGHSGTLRVGRHCATTSYCSSTCQPYAAQQDCAEYGSISNPLYWHKVSTAIQVSSIEGLATAPSQCGYAFGCAVKSCLLGACSGVSFGVSGYGASITLSATGAVLTDMSLNYGAGCSGALEKIPRTTCRCCSSTSGVVVLDVNGGDPLHLPSSDIPLRRLEESDTMHHGQKVRYLMGEWALVSYSPGTKQAGSRAKILGSSSEAFSQSTVEAVSSMLTSSGSGAKGSAAGEQTALIVAPPPHEANSRNIPIPELRVAGGRPPAGSRQGKVLVLADFAEDHRLQALYVLHNTVGGVTPELARYLEKAISLGGRDDEQHRVVVFAVLSIGRSVEVESTFSYLPKCCCGTEFCV